MLKRLAPPATDRDRTRATERGPGPPDLFARFATRRAHGAAKPSGGADLRATAQPDKDLAASRCGTPHATDANAET